MESKEKPDITTFPRIKLAENFADNKIMKSYKIELRSEEVQEILTRPPHGLIRYGISIICAVIIILFIGCFFFKYPDIVTGEVIITTENPPVWLVAKTNGRIKELYCSDKQSVNQGTLLAVIDNTANTIDIQQMDVLLRNVIISDSLFYIPSDILMKSYEFGDIQSHFSLFTKAAINYDNFLTINLTQQEKQALQKQISGKQNYSKVLREQLTLKENELKLGKSAYDRDKLLFERGVISKSEFESSEQTYINLQQSLHQLRNAIISESVESVQMSESVKKISLQYLQEKNQYLSDLKSAYKELQAAIEQWKQTYLLISPINGKMTFNTYWQKDQFVDAGIKIFAVVPTNPGEIIGKITLTSTGIGKVKEGQTANIKINGYPYMEYGVLKAMVNTISLVPDEEDKYTAEVRFINGMKTTTAQIIDLKGELSGQADVITEDKSIGQRLISPLRYLWEDRVN